jgi:hypothetical protein
VYLSLLKPGFIIMSSIVKIISCNQTMAMLGNVWFRTMSCSCTVFKYHVPFLICQLIRYSTPSNIFSHWLNRFPHLDTVNVSPSNRVSGPTQVSNCGTLALKTSSHSFTNQVTVKFGARRRNLSSDLQTSTSEHK